MNELNIWPSPLPIALRYLPHWHRNAFVFAGIACTGQGGHGPPCLTYHVAAHP